MVRCITGHWVNRFRQEEEEEERGGADKKLSVVFIWESRSCGSVVGLPQEDGGRGKARIAAIIHKGKMYDNKIFVNAYKHIFAGKRNY